MIDRKEVDQMAKFMAALTPTQSEKSGPTVQQGAVAESVQQGDVAEMKAILERFHAAADSVVADAPLDRILREALATEATDQGARIGSWEIRINQSGQRCRY